ncbi:hypothetical protein VTJ49DRAFT_490 [Mycothermus thermophilus]|uniref:FAD dependent oxidoreductase domain-containing protein n=1 Tax=Humicola insolens TaxID=85995 RepID=A0ABR3VG66_HUMIN
MTDITIFGAGIIGLSTTLTLLDSNPNYTITIAARDLPGDEPSQNWASPWACAGWVPLGGPPNEQDMQLAALTRLRQIAAEHPPEETGVRSVEQTEIIPVPVPAPSGGYDPLWFAGRVPGYSVLSTSTASPDGTVATTVRYASVVVNPSKFLSWLRATLEAKGVEFVRIPSVSSLAELPQHIQGKKKADLVVVNASGAASATLQDVLDDAVVTDRAHVCVVKSEFQGGFVCRGNGVYTYVFGRGDGTAVLGGVSEAVTAEAKPVEEVRADILSRVHENLPDHFPSPDPADYTILQDLVGIRPLRPAGVKVEKQVIGETKVVHAYGTTIGGYIHSFGLAQAAAKLVDEFVAEGAGST